MGPSPGPGPVILQLVGGSVPGLRHLPVPRFPPALVRLTLHPNSHRRVLLLCFFAAVTGLLFFVLAGTVFIAVFCFGLGCLTYYVESFSSGVASTSNESIFKRSFMEFRHHKFQIKNLWINSHFYETKTTLGPTRDNCYINMRMNS